MSVEPTAAISEEPEPLRSEQHPAVARFPEDAAMPRGEAARLTLTPLVLAGVICGGVLFALALVRLTVGPDNPLAQGLDSATVQRWMLVVSAAASFGFALLAYERQRTLVDAQRAERSFRELYDSISEGVFRSTIDGRVISANPALVQLNGYETEEELIRCCKDIATEWYVDPNRRAEIHQMLLEKGRVNNLVSEVYRHKTRERIWIKESVRLVRKKKTGQPLYYEGNVSEVTETMRRLELQERYSKITSIISGYLLQLRRRPNGTFCMPYASIGLYHMFGIHPEEVTEDSTAYRNLIHRDDYDRVESAIMRSHASLTPLEVEYRLCLPNGKETWVLAHCIPEREADGSTLWHGYVVDISERKRSEEKIHELAYFDTLTKLPNRTSLREHLIGALQPDGQQSRRAMLFIDLDHFKVLNDTKGHHVGDLLLCEIGKRICAIVGPEGVVARFGGDEFVVLLNDLDDDQNTAEARVRYVAEDILSSIDQPFLTDEDRFQTTASIGAVLFSSSDCHVDELMKYADLALYEAKAAGRGRLRFFRREMETAAADRLAFTSDLRQAARDGALMLYFQPVVDAFGRCIGAEGLLRWNHPTRGLITAGEFIEVAERNGFMNEIDKWVVHIACATLKAWESDPRTCDLQLAVNVSAHEMNRLDFVDVVENALAESGARGDRLTLELTEHVMVDDIETVTLVMNRLKKLGLRFALDDFGTGYSSLSYLKQLPIDMLKIDKSFVQDIDSDENDREIVQTIQNVARSLKISVIAEGVETNAQAELLRQYGCHGFQGYLFGKPMPRDSFAAYLEEEAFSAPGRKRSSPKRSAVGGGSRG